jgi:tetratricopeptide (TPR) repeat protein
MSRPTPPLGYSTREVARLLDLSPATVRTYARDGLVTPRRDARGGYRFDFQDLVVLRVARELAATELPPRRVREALASLRRQLPAERSLSAVRIGAEGGEVVVRAGGEAWEPASGQRLLDFDPADPADPAGPAGRAGPVAHRPAAAPEHRAGRPDPAGEPERAEEWYELACELEAADPPAARAAYRSALALDPAHADAHLDLGRLLHEAGDPAAAEEHYRAAVALRPADATAAFNLGVALQDLGRHEEAVGAYRRAVEADATCADAFFNLAQLYDELGQRAAAIGSLKAYKALTGA